MGAEICPGDEMEVVTAFVSIDGLLDGLLLLSETALSYKVIAFERSDFQRLAAD